MATPSFSPASTISSIVLPSTGSFYFVSSSLPFGMYTNSSGSLYSADFISGAVDQVAYTYKKLGGDILDLEITPGNVYAAYEESVLEYSYILNIHQSKNILSNVLGNATGTFDHDGTLKSGPLSSSLIGSHVALKYPRFDLLVERVTPQDVILLFENEIVKIFKRHSQTFKEEKFRKACNQ